MRHERISEFINAVKKPLRALPSLLFLAMLVVIRTVGILWMTPVIVYVFTTTFFVVDDLWSSLLYRKKSEFLSVFRQTPPDMPGIIMLLVMAPLFFAVVGTLVHAAVLWLS